MHHSESALKMAFMIGFVFFITSSMLYAGWIQEDQDGSKTFIADQKIKFVEADADNYFMIIDYSANQITLADGTRKTYATATLDEYCGMMKKMLKAFGQMESAVGGAEESGTPSVEVVAAGKDTIAGLGADKYKVLVDGELFEEVWLASDAGPMKELGPSGRHKKFMECLDDTADPIEGSKAYRELSGKGWELRSISHEFGEKEYNTNVVMLKEVPIADSEFTVPDAYKKIKIDEFFNMGGD